MRVQPTRRLAQPGWTWMLKDLAGPATGFGTERLARLDRLSCALLLALQDQALGVHTGEVSPWQDVLAADPAQCKDRLVRAMWVIPTPLKGALEKLSGGFRETENAAIYFMVQSVGKLPLDSDDQTRIQIGNALRELYAERGEEPEFLTHEFTSKLLVDLADPGPNDIVYDPFAGNCGTLLKAARYVKEKHGVRAAGFQALGCEINEEVWARSLAIAHIYGFPLHLECGNAFEPKSLAQAPTLILTDPPLSIGREGDRYFADDTRPSDKARQSVLDAFSTVYRVRDELEASQGKGFVVVSPRALFGGGAVGNERRKLIKEDVIEAAITLPRGMALPRTRNQTCILALNFNKAASRKQGVLLIDGEGLEKKDDPKKAENRAIRVKDIVARFEREGLPAILKAFHGDQTIPGFSIFVKTDDLANEGWDLSPGRYMEEPAGNVERLDLKELMKTFTVAQGEVMEATRAFEGAVAGVEKYLEARKKKI